MTRIRTALFSLIFWFAGVSQASSANRILECAGVNLAIKGCDGYIRLYLSERSESAFITPLANARF